MTATTTQAQFRQIRIFHLIFSVTLVIYHYDVMTSGGLAVEPKHHGRKSLFAEYNTSNPVADPLMEDKSSLWMICKIAFIISSYTIPCMLSRCSSFCPTKLTS